MNRWTTYFCLGCLLFALSGCGFQLRGFNGNHALQIHRVAIVPDSPYTDLQKQLRKNLDLHGVKIVPINSQPEAILYLENEQMDKRALAIGTDIEVDEYRLRYRLTFKVTDSAGRILLAPQVIQTGQEASNNPNRLLAQNAERSRLYKTMRKNAINQLVRRLARIHTATAKRPPSASDAH